MHTYYIYKMIYIHGAYIYVKLYDILIVINGYGATHMSMKLKQIR